MYLAVEKVDGFYSSERSRRALDPMNNFKLSVHAKQLCQRVYNEEGPSFNWNHCNHVAEVVVVEHRCEA